MAVRQSRIVKERPAADSGRLGKELLGLFLVFCGLLFILSLATFDSRDPWLNHVVSGVAKVHNKAGLFGAYLSGFLYDMIGYAAWIVPVFFCIVGARRILSLPDWAWWRWIGFMLLSLCLSLAGAARDLDMYRLFTRDALPPGSGNISAHGGGIVGHMLYDGLVGWLSGTGTLMIWMFALLLSVQMITGISWLKLVTAVGIFLWEFACERAEKTREALQTRRNRPMLDVRPVPPRPQAPLAVEEGKENMDAGESPLADSHPFAGDYPLEDEQPLADDINAGVERPELFRQAAPVISPAPSVIPSAVTAVSLPATAASSAPSAAAAATLHILTDAVPADADPDEGRHGQQPLSSDLPPLVSPASAGEDFPDDFFMNDKGLLRDNAPPGDAPELALNTEMDEEDDLPPWVRDFEEDRLGLRSGKRLSEPFSMPSETVQGTLELQAPPDFSMISGGNDHAEYQASAMLDARQAPEPEAGRPFAPEAVSVPDVVDPEKTENLHSDGESFDKPAPAGLPAPSTGSVTDVPTVAAPSHHRDIANTRPVEAESVPDSRTPSEEREKLHVTDEDKHKPLADGTADNSGYAGPVRILDTPEVKSAPDASGTGLLASAIRLIKKPVRVPLPPLDLLEPAPSQSGGTPRSVLESKGRSLMTCLNDFGIQGELVGITPGPVVTMFEVRPAPGVRVSRIANLSDDLALALKAVAVRIQAPVPGTDTVGIEIPNENRETVCLKELLGSQLFQEAKSLLTLALGKDIAGAPAVADLATMPHLLVAGATGAGKSVGINSIILSLIYKARPDEVKLLLVDPKRVEMAIYADLPHLVHPVVTEMQLAKNALEWAVAEMEQRYNNIAKAGVRNIADYNAKVLSFGDAPPPGLDDLEVMPYLVIIIDELADLMLTAAKEVETSIVRLAQLARAAGIHLILATQRPSVDVVTGLIKANFPCRISFQVTSKHDSRTILDAVGAEHLLGKGDMLFKPGGGKFRRLHGAFVSDKNVNSVVDYWRSQQKPDYQIDFADWAPDAGGSGFSGNGGGGGGGDISSDPVYNEAVEFVRQQGKASISLIQRKFRIGFNKAARFVEQMEQDGIIGPADGSRPRMVIR